MIGINHAYWSTHEEFGDARWASKQDFVVSQIAQAGNNAKLDRIVESIDAIQVQIAITTVNDFQRQLDAHQANPQQTVEWIRERDRLTRQVRRAEEYKQCLIAQRPACDQLRGW
jgi:hypothetical protein